MPNDIPPSPDRLPEFSPRRIAVTGAAGRIGSYFAAHAPDAYELTLTDHPDVGELDELSELGTIARAALSDVDLLKELFAGCDTLVHLAANPSPRTDWASGLRDNIAGTYHAMTAAVEAGVRRIIFASSIHAVSGYRRDVQVKACDPVRPGDFYGVTKCFGEALGAWLAYQRQVSIIAIRIGAFQPIETAKDPDAMQLMDAFVSRRDLFQLICRAIEADAAHLPEPFAIVHGVSDNAFKRLDITTARDLLGYDPEDDLTEYNPQTRALHLDDALPQHAESD